MCIERCKSLFNKEQKYIVVGEYLYVRGHFGDLDFKHCSWIVGSLY